MDDEQLDYLAAHDDLSLVAYSPLLKGTYDDPAKRRGHHVMAAYEGSDTDARLRWSRWPIRSARHRTRWCSPGCSAARARLLPLIGPRTVEQLDAAMEALAVQLTTEQRGRLAAAADQRSAA